MYEPKFTFHVNGKSYSTSRIFVDVLSPFVRNLHHTDESINELNITTGRSTKESEEDFFSDFLKLVTFESISIDEERRKKFIEYFKILGNCENSPKIMFLIDYLLSRIIQNILQTNSILQ
ncbi:hypothetical protein M9Y10_045896 [Tritrichomonas musculus]|uniref:BTB domain-containing protein n=1 Tax=Tritrichomonas musculus TaxID=1915356 RepID=A0ABR2JWJ6_9EUKA